MGELQKNILVELNVPQLNNLVTANDKGYKNVILLKFTADWCNPCKKIKQICDKYFKQMPKSVILIEIDIDNQLDLYMFFKKSSVRVVTGIPAMLVWIPDSDRDMNTWYLPDHSFSGGDINEVTSFLETVKKEGQEL